MAMTPRGLVLGATVVMLSTVTLVGAGLHLKGQAFFQDAPKELVDEVWQIIDKLYVDATFNQVDWRAIRAEYVENRSYTNREEAYTAVREMLEKLEDPYTRFMDPDEFRNMQIDTSGELTGVGIQLSQDEETKELIVISPIEESPAFEAGVQAQDVILKIDGESTEGMDLSDAVERIRGQVGTSVVLTIRRGSEELEFEIVRALIEIHPVRYSYRSETNEKVGYIRLVQFSANAAEEMEEAIRDLETQGVDGYVLDVRSNPGGLLHVSVEIARMWMNEGTIVSIVNRRGELSREKARGQALTDKPLVILVDGGSASASEILSGALQDNDRAVLVGTQTFGKGLVQSVRPLRDGSGLAVTIAKYFTPAGRDINKEGIAPDVTLELTEEQREFLREDRERIGGSEDPQYTRALEVLHEEVVKFNSQTPQRTSSAVGDR
ncbi:MAG: PDZ domain-containing protein [Coleofasciculaceae cyanobacterium SM2_3_26]|nr:PDZ domain-containing protein [Coleofasciculaceae cyanobacterium SM2_3_26]